MTRLLPYAVKHPLDEFWEKTDGGWVSPRGHQKIVSLRGKSDANRRAGAAGKRPTAAGSAREGIKKSYRSEGNPMRTAAAVSLVRVQSGAGRPSAPGRRAISA